MAYHVHVHYPVTLNHYLVHVVCRYGGIFLHADRFKHINNIARILLRETGLGQEVMCLQHINSAYICSTLQKLINVCMV